MASSMASNGAAPEPLERAIGIRYQKRARKPKCHGQGVITWMMLSKGYCIMPENGS